MSGLASHTERRMVIQIFTTGGSIDKYYSTQESDFIVGEPAIGNVLDAGNVTIDYHIAPLLHKDSLDITDADRQAIVQAVRDTTHRHIVITHGTDTMVETALTLASIPDKVIVLTGAMQPAAFTQSDAPFNVGCAIMAVQTLPAGVYITMNGRIFDPQTTAKNVAADRFERIP